MALCHELINSRTKKKKTYYQASNMQYPRAHYHISYLEFILVGGIFSSSSCPSHTWLDPLDCFDPATFLFFPVSP